MGAERVQEGAAFTCTRKLGFLPSVCGASASGSEWLVGSAGMGSSDAAGSLSTGGNGRNASLASQNSKWYFLGDVGHVFWY